MAQGETTTPHDLRNRSWDRTPAGVPLEYLRRMTDDTGMIQHGIGGVPDSPTGYTTDDNARALLAAVRLWRRAPERRAEVEPLLRRYVQFMTWVQVRGGDNEGWFVNFVSYDRRFLDERGTEDCLGRCLWCLGEVADGELPAGTRLAVQQMLSKAIPPIRSVSSPRARAYALLGLCHAASHDKPLIRELVMPLAELYKEYSKPGWDWFEPYMTYDNARMVEAVLRAAEVLDDNELREIGQRTLKFLTEKSFQAGYLEPIGCRGWWKEGEDKAPFDQQTIEAGAYAELYRLVGDEKHANLAIEWFDGHNVHGLPVYDPDSGGCYDGLTAEGVNLNMGAESVLSHLLAVTS